MRKMKPFAIFAATLFVALPAASQAKDIDNVISAYNAAAAHSTYEERAKDSILNWRWNPRPAALMQS